MIAGLLLGFLPLAAWLYLLLGRGGFWRMRARDDRDPPRAPSSWPAVAAIVPARNEADVIQASLTSLLAQDYPGAFRVVLVDDQSEDGTEELARALAQAKLVILKGAAASPGWTGKLWAMQQGADHAEAFTPDFLWFTDADIAHAPDNLSRLVARAQTPALGGQPYALVSLMARLSCANAAEHFLIPAFVFFFAMLYPFGAVNDPGSGVAAAAGGCMLVRRSALLAAGGLAAIRHNLIDDCALGRALKAQGPIWLGLTDRSVSLRPYGFSDIRRMIARSAYAQLGFSPFKLAATLAGLVLLYFAPPLTALFAWGTLQMAGWIAWLVMALMFQPILRFYRLSPFWGLALPLIGAFYAGFTLDSALQHWAGRGGMWKGRVQAGMGRAP